MRGKLIVTDHAVLRYLERAWGVDIDALRLRIARNAQAATLCPIEGATAVRVNGLRYSIANGHVLTVGPVSMKPYDPALARNPRRRDGAGVSAELPGVLGQIAEAVGVDVARKVAIAFGGRTVTVAKNPRPDSVLARVIGVEAARKVAREIGAGDVKIPQGPRRRDLRCKALLAEGRLSHAEISELVGLDQRTVERHAKTMRDSRQLALDLQSPPDRRARRRG